MSSIFNLVPTLSSKMDNILQRYDEFHKKTYLEEFTEMNPEIVTALKTAEDEFRSSYSKRIMGDGQIAENQTFKAPDGQSSAITRDRRNP
jgi:hypothetical protein